jgi:phosphatidylglycerol:prolipoprotein diacylglycerol transferase
MLPIIHIGPLAIQTSGLILLVGFWFGLDLARRQASSLEIIPQTVDNLVLISTITGVMGARLAVVSRYPGAFLLNPASLVSLNLGLFDVPVGIFLAVLAGWLYAQSKQLSVWILLDILTPGFALFAAAMGFSDLASGSAFGAPTSLPWGIQLWGAKRHPSQVYEILAAIAIFVIVWRFSHPRATWRLPAGLVFLAFAALTSFSTLILEAFRDDSVLIMGQLHRNQLIAWVLLAVCLSAMGAKLKFSQAGDKQYVSNHQV